VASIADQIQARFANADLSISSQQSESILSYFGLLTKWNKTINLTALALDPPTPQTLIDCWLSRWWPPELRAVCWTRWTPSVAGETLRLLDVGSGGGSPAIPLAIGLGKPTPGVGFGVELSMVESRGRKAAFLREVVRDIPLDGARVYQSRLEELQPQAFESGLDPRRPRRRRPVGSARRLRQALGLGSVVPHGRRFRSGRLVRSDA
jgi:16S rRNA (guanine527-N7)-methyltransferase